MNNFENFVVWILGMYVFNRPMKVQATNEFILAISSPNTTKLLIPRISFQTLLLAHKLLSWLYYHRKNISILGQTWFEKCFSIIFFLNGVLKTNDEKTACFTFTLMLCMQASVLKKNDLVFFGFYFLNFEVENVF